MTSAGGVVQILPDKVGIAEIAVEVGHRKHHPIVVLWPVGQIIGNQGMQDIGGQPFRADLFKPRRQFRRQLRLHAA